MHRTIPGRLSPTRHTRPRSAALLSLACLVVMLVAGAAQASHEGPQPPRPPRPPATHTNAPVFNGFGPQGGYGHQNGPRAKREYVRGQMAGARAGRAAGYRDGRNWLQFCPIPPACRPGTSRAFIRGFNHAYGSAYTTAYRQAQVRACHPPRRPIRPWWRW